MNDRLFLLLDNVAGTFYFLTIQTNKMRKYKVFTRTWWKANSDWPDGLEPHMGNKTIICYVETEEEAQKICEQWNKTHKPGRFSRKAEYTSDF